MFDFTTIEDKSFHNPVVKILINNITNSDELYISNLNLNIIRDICIKKKIKNIEDIKDELYEKIKLSKKDKIRYDNSLLKFNLFFRNILENKYIISSIYDYIIETIMIISKLIDKPRSYCLKLAFSYNYLYKKYNFKLFKLFYKKLFTFIKKSNQLDILKKFPEIYHSKNLIPLLDETMEPFQHQKSFINVIKNKKRKVIINASPIGSGKTILQTATIMYNKIQHNKSIILITCPNKVVLETVAQACNNENTIAYWFMYDDKLVPSYFCQPRRKKSKHQNNVSKPSEKELHLQYKHYVTQYYKILNDSIYIKNFYLPDVIFALPEQALKLLKNREMNTLINKIVIDEFLIPSFNNFKELLNESQNCDEIILLSASAPKSKELFIEKYPEIMSQIKNYELEYIFESIIPSFIYCKTLDENNWLPTNELNAENYNKKIKNFNWYHYRFYPPQIIYEMKKEINVFLPEGEKYKIDLDIKYKEINEFMKEAEEFLLSICEKSDEIKNQICNFNFDLNLKLESNNKSWMIITNNSINYFNFEEKENIEDKLIEYLDNVNSIEKEKLELEKQLESFEKCTIKNKENSTIENHLEKKRKLEEKLNSLNCNIHLSLENGINSIEYNEFLEIKKFLELSFDNSTIINNILIELFYGNIIYDIKGPYYKYISNPQFITKNLYVSPIMAYGTDMNIYGVKIIDEIDEVTLVQAFGRAGRARKDIYVPVYAPIESLKNLI